MVFSRSIARFVLVSAMWLCMVVVSHSTCAAELILVEQGKLPVPIIIAKEAAPLTSQNANELADYLEKATGVRPAIIEGAPTPLPASAIWLGSHPQLPSLFPDVDLQLSHPEEIVIAANANHLLIMGRDRWIPGHTALPAAAFSFGTNDVSPFQQEYGTANAVYSFLHDKLGVRWFWPGEEDVPRQDRLALEPFVYRYHPQIRQRQSIIWQLSRFRAAGRDGTPSANWARFNHLQLDSLDVRIQSHGFGDWWPRFHESHPEYFALQPDGTRSGFPGGAKGNWAKMCVSNPDVWEQWLVDVDVMLQENPNRTAFTCAANDGWAAGHCVCENCRAWDHPDGKKRSLRWKGISSDYVALSNRELHLANTLARLLKKRYPDKQLYVSTHAYGLSRPAPVDLKPDDNVIISAVANFFLRPDLVDTASYDNELHIDQYKAWAKVTPNIFWRPNTGNPAHWRTGGYASLNQIIDHFKLLKETQCIGVSIDTVWGYWGTQAPAYYLMSQLAWNVNLDGQAVLDDYYTRAFGKAAGDVKAYWDLAEQTRAKMMADDLPWEQAFTMDFFDQAQSLLDEAARKLDSDDSDDKRRLIFVTDGLKFLRLQTQAILIANRLTAAKDQRDPADIQALQAIWIEFQELAKRNPYLLNSGQVLRNPAKSHLKAIHPDNYM